MLTPFLGFEGRAIAGVFTVNAAAQSGLAMSVAGDNSSNTTGVYGNNFGSVSPATIITSGTIRETGYLLQPVTATGPSIFSVLASIYDESVAAGTVASIVLSQSGNIIATDQYVASGTGAIAFAGTVLPGAALGLINGQPRVLQSGDVARGIFMGQVLQRTIPCLVMQII